MNNLIKVVIAEDSPTQAVRLQFMLEEYNFEVHLGEDGKQALELVKEIAPDVVISDIMMPVMDGYELTRSIKEDPALSNIPVILLSTLTGLSDILKGLECGADNYIIKPFEEEDLIAKINTAIDPDNKGITERTDGSLEVTYGEHLYNIDSKSTKLADFLITTYETALQKNNELEQSQKQLKELNESLEEKVEQRTSALLKEATERKQYQYALEESEKRYRFLYNNSPDGIVQIDQNGIIIDCNDSECELIKYKKEEIIGKHLTFFENKRSAEAFEERMIFLENKGYLEAEVNLLKKDGTLLPVWRKVSANYDDDGVFIGAIVNTRDITDRKEAEEQLSLQNMEYQSLNEEYLVQNEKLTQSMLTLNNAYSKLEAALEQATESDRLKTAFLQNISHEIRTPMNGIMGFTELLDDPELTFEEMQEFIVMIRMSGDRLLDTVTDLMDISLIESKLMRISSSDVEIKNKIEQISSKLMFEAKEKGINLSFKDCFLQKDMIINTDSEKFVTILTKLIRNAIKFTHKGTISVGYSQNADHVEFCVTDSGIGIPKDRQEAIFERFIQADIEDKEVFEGSGLGLSISKAFVEMLGGNIRVVSEVGVGSEFYFSIPHKTDKKKTVIPKTKATKQNDSIRFEKELIILVAEDENLSFSYLATILSPLSKEILHAKNGKEVVKLHKENPDVDVILMDIKMPEMNGYEATRRIRELDSEILIIAQTAYARSGDREKAIEAGCNDYISKPILKNRLFKMIENHMK